MMTLDQLQTEIKEWSFRNFKDNSSKAMKCDYSDHPAELKMLAPLLGLVEEFGEFDEAVQKNGATDRKSDVLDAIGDMCIYLLDFCWRDGMTMTPIPIGQSLKQAGLAVLIGKLAHVVLKRHQGIRGYDDYTKYDNDRRERVFAILFRLNNIVAQWYGMTLLNVIENTWSKVKQRDWEKNKKNAQASAWRPESEYAKATAEAEDD